MEIEKVFKIPMSQQLGLTITETIEHSDQFSDATGLLESTISQLHPHIRLFFDSGEGEEIPVTRIYNNQNGEHIAFIDERLTHEVLPKINQLQMDYVDRHWKSFDLHPDGIKLKVHQGAHQRGETDVSTGEQAKIAAACIPSFILGGGWISLIRNKCVHPALRPAIAAHWAHRAMIESKAGVNLKIDQNNMLKEFDGILWGWSTWVESSSGILPDQPQTLNRVHLEFNSPGDIIEVIRICEGIKFMYPHFLQQHDDEKLNALYSTIDYLEWGTMSFLANPVTNIGRDPTWKNLIAFALCKIAETQLLLRAKPQPFTIGGELKSTTFTCYHSTNGNELQALLTSDMVLRLVESLKQDIEIEVRTLLIRAFSSEHPVVDPDNIHPLVMIVNRLLKDAVEELKALEAKIAEEASKFVGIVMPWNNKKKIDKGIVSKIQDQTTATPKPISEEPVDSRIEQSANEDDLNRNLAAQVYLAVGSIQELIPIEEVEKLVNALAANLNREAYSRELQEKFQKVANCRHILNLLVLLMQLRHRAVNSPSTFNIILKIIENREEVRRYIVHRIC